MIKILFVCHGNICRSPMAEFVMKDLVDRIGLSEQFEIASAATSREEIGNTVHPGTRAKLSELGISTKGKIARQMTKDDYKYYDYIIAMDTCNVKNINRIIGADLEHKVSLLLSHAGDYRDIADPWYTGNFEETYDDVVEGCKAFLKKII